MPLNLSEGRNRRRCDDRQSRSDSGGVQVLGGARGQERRGRGPVAERVEAAAVAHDPHGVGVVRGGVQVPAAGFSGLKNQAKATLFLRPYIAAHVCMGMPHGLKRAAGMQMIPEFLGP